MAGHCGANPDKIRRIDVRARSSNWIEQGTPKPKVASSILAGRTIQLDRSEADRYARRLIDPVKAAVELLTTRIAPIVRGVGSLTRVCPNEFRRLRSGFIVVKPKRSVKVLRREVRHADVIGLTHMSP
jgi:hypothetical protein